MLRNWRGLAIASRWLLVGVMALFPVVGHALALGKLKVLSALNEPLNAEIEFTSITEKELKGLSVTLASRADFDTAGIERQPFLNQIKFIIDRRSDGRHFLRLRTDQQVDEPFLHLLLQIEWPGGRLVREYTALIDPPYRIAGKAAPVETPVITPPAPAPAAKAKPPAPPPAVPETPPEKMKKEEIPTVTTQPEPRKEPEVQKVETVPPKEVVKEAPPAPFIPDEQKFGPPDIALAPAPAPTGSATVEPLAATSKTEAVPKEEKATVAERKPKPTPVLADLGDYSVKRGDTLWRIAEQARGDDQDVTIEQMILAIYRTNKDAFFGNNVNNLKAGKILKFPERAEIESVTETSARREFRAQYDAWQEYKLKLASASGAIKVPEATNTPAMPAAPAKSAAAVEKPAAVSEPKKAPVKPAEKPAPTVADKGKQDELLKIVRSTLDREKGTPDKPVSEKESAKEVTSREQQALAERAATLEETLESKRLENQELSEKLGVVRSQLKNEARLIELESQALAQKPKPTETKPVETKPAEPKPGETVAKAPDKPATPPAEEKVKVEPLPPPAAAAPAAPKKRVPPPPPPPPQEKDFLATVMDAVQSDLLVPGLIGFVVLLSGGIALVYFRRRQKSIAEFEESILSADAISTEQPATTGTVVGQQPAATTGGDTSFLSDFSQGGMGNIHTDEVDPIAEAEVYLAYGRDETAEEILKEAMLKNPNRHEIKVKLLEIYHQRNDVSAFETLAEELYAAQGGRGGKMWDKVEEMGRKLNPDNPMFRGGAPAKTPAATAVPKVAPVTGVKTQPVPSATPTSVDFKSTPTETAKTEVAGDFDFEFETPAGSDEPKPKDGTDDFSVAMPESASVPKSESSLDSLDLGPAVDNSVNFDLGGESPPAPAEKDIKWEPEPVSAGGEVDLEAPSAPAEEGPGSGQWDEAATKLDLAKAYIDMGDAEGARSILQEVMAEGNEAQKKQAQELSSQIT